MDLSGKYKIIKRDADWRVHLQVGTKLCLIVDVDNEYEAMPYKDTLGTNSWWSEDEIKEYLEPDHSDFENKLDKLLED